jgi:hypothetical protein
MTVTDIIAEALEQLGVLAAGETVTAQDQATCLTSFKTMVQSLPGFGIGRDLIDVVVTTSPYTPKMNERVYWNGVGSLTLNLPALVDNLPPKNGDRVAVTSGGNTGVFVYIASKGAWLVVDGITDDTDSPLGPDCDKALADMLAFEVAPKFQVQPSQMIYDRKVMGRDLVTARFRRAQSNVLNPFWNRLTGQGQRTFII